MKRILAIFILALFLVTLVYAAPNWEKFNKEPTHKTYEATGAMPIGNYDWNYSVTNNRQIWSSAAMNAGVNVGGGVKDILVFGDDGGNFWMLNAATGALVGSTGTANGQKLRSSPVITKDMIKVPYSLSGVIPADYQIFFGDDAGVLNCFHENGLATCVPGNGGVFYTTGAAIRSSPLYISHVEFIFENNLSLEPSPPNPGPCETAGVFFGSDDGKVYALDAKYDKCETLAPGTPLMWSFDTTAPVRSSPMHGQNLDLKVFNYTTMQFEHKVNTSAIFVGSDSGTLYSFLPWGLDTLMPPGGTVAVWGTTLNTESPAPIRSSPALSAKTYSALIRDIPGFPDGKIVDTKHIYVGSDDSKFYGINAVDGSIAWSRAVGGPIRSSAAVLDHSPGYEFVYIGSDDGKVYNFEGSSGTKVWEYDTGSKIRSSPVVSPKGDGDYLVYFTTCDGWLYAIRQDGVVPAERGIVWKLKLDTGSYTCDNDSEFRASPVLYGGDAFVGTPDGKFMDIKSTAPDLTMSAFVLPGGNVYEGATAPFAVVINNSATATDSAPAGTQFGIYKQGSSSPILPLQSTAGALAIGASAPGLFTWNTTGQAGTHTLCATADPNNGITELNETNNANCKSFTVYQTVNAEADGPYSGSIGNPINFDGTASTGTGLTYSWDFGDGTAAGTGATPTHTYTTVGTYTATLTVTDSVGGTDSDTATVSISETPNVAPTANAGADKTGNVGEVLTFSGSGTDTDGTIAKYEWDFENDGTYDYNSTSTGATTHAYNTAGTYTAKLRVTDDDGATATDTIQVVISAVVNAPTVRISSPSNNATVSGTLTITGTASDDVSVLGVQVSVTGAWLAANGATSWNYAWDTTKVYDGGYTIRARSFDGTYYSSMSSVSVTVNNGNAPPAGGSGGLDGLDGTGGTDGDGTTDGGTGPTAGTGNKPPVARAGSDIMGITGEEVVFPTYGTDSDGTIVKYEWDFTGNGKFDWSSSTAQPVAYTYDEPGTYVATLRVTDDSGATDTDAIIVVITAPEGTVVEGEETEEEPGEEIVVATAEFKFEDLYPWIGVAIIIMGVVAFIFLKDRLKLGGASPTEAFYNPPETKGSIGPADDWRKY
ncbi:MAG: PKD domain-containing protein [Candidatus Diapherotrites archaeon]|nr:PKD domain-containing protein [Candidatus Diapherotrites archaeon]